jgi:proteasome lid subunit RPN8/RPN11
MSFDLIRANQIKELLEKAPIHHIISYAQRTYPNECCGFILESGAVFPAHNIVESLCDKSLTSKNAFLIDNDSWNIASNRESPIAGIYHSHPNGETNMSAADYEMLHWENLYYIIVGLIDYNPVAAKMFWWEQGTLKELHIQIKKED